jgi:hypothetical protein
MLCPKISSSEPGRLMCIYLKGFCLLSSTWFDQWGASARDPGVGGGEGRWVRTGTISHLSLVKSLEAGWHSSLHRKPCSFCLLLSGSTPSLSPIGLGSSIVPKAPLQLPCSFVNTNFSVLLAYPGWMCYLFSAGTLTVTQSHGILTDGES